MRPDHPKSTSTARSTARARLLIAENLAWLRGFFFVDSEGRPRWRTIPAVGEADDGESIAIDRERIRRAHGAIAALLRNHEDCLADVVGDPADWKRRVERQLDHVKPLAHGAVGLPSIRSIADETFPRRLRSTAEGLIERRPALAMIVEPLLSVHYVDPSPLAQILGFLQEVAPALATLFAQRGDDRVAELVGIVETVVATERRLGKEIFSRFEDPRAFTVAIDRLGAREADRLASAMGRGVPYEPGRHKGTRGAGAADVLFEALVVLRKSPAEHHRRLLRLVSLFSSSRITDEWEKLWTQFAFAERKHRQSLLAGKKPTTLAKEIALLRRQNHLHIPLIVERRTIAEFLEHAARLDADALAALVDLFAVVPKVTDDDLFATALAATWFSEVGRSIASSAKTLSAMRRDILSSTVMRDAVLGRSAIGETGFREYRIRTEFMSELAVNERRHPDAYVAFAPAYRAAAELANADEAPSPRETKRAVEVLFELARAMPTAAAAADAIRAWTADADCQKMWWVSPGAIYLAARMTISANESFPRMLAGVSRSEISKCGDDLLEKIADHYEIGLCLARMLADREDRRAARFVACLKFLDGDRPGKLSIKIPDHPKPKAEEWMSFYPATFLPALLRLATASPRAEEEAHRLLFRDFPRHRDLAAEIASIREKLDDTEGQKRSRLLTRLGNLERRLTSRPKASKIRIETLSKKLSARAEAAEIGRVESAVQSALRRRIAKWFPDAGFDATKIDPELLALIGPVHDLPDEIRALGIRLIARAALGKKDGLRDDPRNIAFLDRLRRRGVDPAPWIAHDRPRRSTLKNGRVVTVALADDPIDVMRMGAPFKTCLSPGDFNFFAAVVNAADVNKRVLFARREDGQVHGRCLLALSDRGEVVTYVPYCHEADSGFEDIVAESANEMARRLGTRVSTAGAIAPLLAKTWYADPARDLEGRFADLEPTAEFLRKLAEVSAAVGRPMIAERFGKEPFGDEVMRRLLACREIVEKDDWADFIVEGVEAPESLNDADFEQFSELVMRRRGALRTERRVFERVRRHVMDGLAPTFEPPFSQFVFAKWAAEVAAVDPTAVLARLKATRPAGVGSFTDEIISWRLSTAAWAHFSLGRKVAARSLLKKIVQSAEKAASRADDPIGDAHRFDRDVDPGEPPEQLSIDEILSPSDRELLRLLDLRHGTKPERPGK